MAALLLSEITTIKASTFIHDLRSKIAVPTPTSIDPLDDVLSSFNLNPHSRTNANGTKVKSPLPRGALLELQGASGTGKTSMLYFMVMTRILPREHTFKMLSSPITKRLYDLSALFGGLSTGALVFDLTYSFSTLRLRDIMVQYILKRLAVAATENYEATPDMLNWIETSVPLKEEIFEFVKTLLRDKLWIWRCDTTLDLAIALGEVEAHHKNDEDMSKVEIGLLAIDGIGENYWDDRYEQEQHQIPLPNSSRKSTTTPHPFEEVLANLTNIRQKIAPLCVVTTQSFYPISTSSILFKQHLPRPWFSPFPLPSTQSQNATGARPLPSGILPLTAHITLIKSQQQGNRPFCDIHQGRDLKAVLEQEKSRLENVAESSVESFVGIVRVPPPDTKAKVKESSFNFCVGQDGLFVTASGEIDRAP